MFSPLITIGLLAASALPPGGDTNTRIAPGTITIEQSDDDAAPAFTDAVQSAILRASFIPLPAPSHSRYIAIVTVTRNARGVVTAGTKGTAPVAGVSNWGAGVGVRLPTKKDQIRGLIVTELKVTIVLRSDQHPLWSGSAVTAQVKGTRAGAPDVVAGKLTDALFAQFPNRLDAPLSVP